MASAQTIKDGPEVFGAGPNVCHRSLILWIFGEHGVLFQRVPAVVPVCAHVSDNGGDINVAGSQRPVHPLPDCVAIGQLT